MITQQVPSIAAAWAWVDGDDAEVMVNPASGLWAWLDPPAPPDPPPPRELDLVWRWIEELQREIVDLQGRLLHVVGLVRQLADLVGKLAKQEPPRRPPWLRVARRFTAWAEGVRSKWN